MTNKNIALNNKSTEFLLYTSPNGDIKVEVFFIMKMYGLLKKR